MTGRVVNKIKMNKTNYCHFENYRDKTEFLKNIFHGNYIKKAFTYNKYMRIIYCLNNTSVKLIASN